MVMTGDLTKAITIADTINIIATIKDGVETFITTSNKIYLIV